MTLKNALDTLASTDFGTTVRRHYTIEEVRGGIGSPQVPCLIPVLESGTNARETYGETSALFNEYHTLRHLYLNRAATGLIGEAMYETAQQVDSYYNAVQNLTDRTGALDIRVTGYQSGNLEWGGVSYYGCAFTVVIWVSE